ncbi:EF-hand calcium-binding domain-containing protein 5-like [Crassostrea angulata]|uniref:EF-hand calcium-binding domain-containing protein 5-like n=1 Tax=Magallana angulata TaxID=2784310 RepID=UPI0022B1941C|nr:EF-hand calcium-binding domain-containing protein 5-like [Crassostrea angulata]XP_052717744.1 EF-hand calcium-binding domain-containing protein 5-like [Crassostrea angulata]XP_052717745.1 EF-hand calcium-binding domain-containing protein 5-like [Crassostrea angulata]
MADIQKPGSPTKRVTMAAPHSAGSSGQRSAPGSGRKSPTDYSRPIVRSAVRRWKRMHEQSMMEKLVGMRNEKKQQVKTSKESAKKLARKIPIEVLARDWLNENEATLEVRTYMVDKVLPNLILGVEKLLSEADKRGLTDGNGEDPDFNPINFLAQYMMRNNPRYSNFSEASPYVRGIREVSEELKKQLFNIEDNRLARIKAEAKRRREERDKLERLKQEERDRRETKFMKQFEEWHVQPDGRVELSLVQNALRSFAEIAENFPEDLKDGYKLSRALEPTDESGKALSVKEFAKYLTMFVDDFNFEVFEQFMQHLSLCADSYRAASNREQRRIVLTNLFISCDHSGIGLLDRHRILSLFEAFWDSIKEDIKKNVRNPRRWPVAEVDEVEDIFDDDGVTTPVPKVAEPTPASPTPAPAEPAPEKTEETEQGGEEKIEIPATTAQSKPVTPEIEPETKPSTAEPPAEKPAPSPKPEEAGKPGVEVLTVSVEESDEANKSEEPKMEEKQEEKPTEATEEAKSEEKKEEQGETKTATPPPTEEKTEPEKSEIKAEPEKTEEKDEPKVTEKEASSVGEGEKDTAVTKTSEAPSSVTTTTEEEKGNVKFAVGTTFNREKTALTTMSKGSGQSAFDENSLNVSQFVTLTETFLGNEPTKESFNMLTKYVKDGYEETEEEKMERLMKARKEALSTQRKHMMDSLFEKWDNDGCGYLDMEDVETVMQKYKEGQENEAIVRAKSGLKKQSKYADNRLSKREFRTFVQLVVDEMPGADSFDYFVEFLVNSVERSYAERIRGEARKKWLQQIVTAAETGGASMEPVYRAVFNALYKDAEAHGGGKRISANIAMLERNTMDPDRGSVCLRYVAATMEDADYLLGKILYKDMKGISFAAVESGKPIHVPRVANHGNIQFWNPYRQPEDREGSFIVVPLKDKRKRVFGLLGIDTMNDHHTKTIFITHEIQFFQGVAKSFSISYHNIDMKKKLLRITESAVSWIHRRSPHVQEIVTYMVEPGMDQSDYILRKMMITDEKGNVQNLLSPPRLERKDNLFRDYLFKCVDNSETVSADAYGQRHLAFPLRDDQGKAVAVVDISIGELKNLPEHENREVQRMLKLLNQAHKEITKEFSGEADKTVVLEAEKDDDNRMDIMFDRLMLMELRENVSKIDSKSFAELRSYNEPPKIVQNIVKAVVAIFHLEQVESGELDDWTNLRNFINNELLQKITEYDPTAASDHALIPPEKLEVFLKDVPHGEVGKFGSIPAQNMYNWVFVCISLIEHTIKMRENNGGNVAASTHQSDTTR